MGIGSTWSLLGPCGKKKVSSLKKYLYLREGMGVIILLSIPCHLWKTLAPYVLTMANSWWNQGLFRLPFLSFLPSSFPSATVLCLTIISPSFLWSLSEISPVTEHLLEIKELITCFCRKRGSYFVWGKIFLLIKMDRAKIILCSVFCVPYF